MRANRVDRDQIQNEDKITIYIDPFMDQQRAFAFSVNAYGVQGEFLISDSAPFGDVAWNSLFDAAGSPVEDGWMAEMSVPFKSLRYPARPRGEPHRWGIQFERDIESKNEAVVWSPMSSDVMGGFVRQLGVLEGLTNLSTSRNLEFLPTATAIHVGNLDRATGTFGTEGVQEAGLNLKYGITSDLTFDFTYNPDFSQIESDRPQIEVNQRFPIFFPELRPFFLEGREIYEVSGPVTVVHTRTIVDPRYGAKLSGKIGNTSLGLLFADDEAPGRVDDPDDPAFDRAAQVVLARVRYDYSAGSHIGGLFTDREVLDSFSRLAAIDGRWQICRNYRLELKAMTTRRQDVNGVKKTGELAEVAWRKEGRNFNYDVSSQIVDPDFGTDVGFVRRTDLRRTQGNVLYRWWPESWIINWSPTFAYERNSGHTGVLQDHVFQTGIQALFDKRVDVRATVNRDLERFAGIDFWKTRYSFRSNVSTSRRVSFGVNVNAGDQIRFVANPFLGSEAVTTLTMTLRPFTRLQSDLRLNTSRFVDRRTDAEAFDVKIFRAVTTYQLTDRLVIRNISQYNSFDKELDANILFTYRVNSGTVFFAGYDDHYRQGNQDDDMLFPTSAWRRTNRAIFTKLQYLFRY